MAGKNKDASLNKRAFTSGFSSSWHSFLQGADICGNPGLFKAADKGTVRCSQNLRVMASDCLHDYVALSLA